MIRIITKDPPTLAHTPTPYAMVRNTMLAQPQAEKQDEFVFEDSEVCLPLQLPLVLNSSSSPSSLMGVCATATMGRTFALINLPLHPDDNLTVVVSSHLPC